MPDPAQPSEEYISHIGEGRVEVISLNPSRRWVFADLGGQKTGIMGGHWRFGYSSDEDLEQLLTKLEELGLTAHSERDPT